MTGDTESGKEPTVAAKPALYAFLLLIVTAVLIALFFAISAAIRYFMNQPSARDTPERAIQLQPYGAPPAQNNAGDIPTSPARRPYATYVSNASRARNAAGPGTAADSIPGTLPSGALLSAMESGKTIFLPNPKGDCELIHGASASATQKLDDCFAGRKSAR